MRSELALALSICVVILGCEGLGAGRRYGAGVKVQPARILDAEGDQGEAEPDAPQPGAQPAGRGPVIPETPAVEKAAATEPGAATASGALEEVEMSPEWVISFLENKQNRTPAEQETYTRLLGPPPDARAPGEDDPAYKLLDGARDAVTSADFETAEEMVTEALALLRLKTDPKIDRLFFADEVRNYGNADVLEDPTFSPGQMVLVVVDLSNFAVETKVLDSGPKRYQARMTQRLAIYDDGERGQLRWQNSYGPFEYQADGYIFDMFIPRKFFLPSKLKPGQYIVKAEIIDHFAGRQTESIIKFAVR